MSANDFNTTDENTKELDGMEGKEFKIATKCCPFCGGKAALYIDWQIKIKDDDVRKIAAAKGVDLENEEDDFIIDEIAREAFSAELEADGLTYTRKMHIYCPKCRATISDDFHRINSPTSDEEEARELAGKWNKDFHGRDEGAE